MLVKPALFNLEGDIKSIEVDYLQGGQSVQTDFFVITNGDLVLMRRIARGQSVSYRTGTALTGVRWLSLGTATGENFTTNTTALLSRDNSEAATAYRIITEVPAARWDADRYYDEDAFLNDAGRKTPSRWGGFLPEVPFDALA